MTRFGRYYQTPEGQDSAEERVAALKRLLGVEEGEEQEVAALSFKSQRAQEREPGNRRDAAGCRIDKPHGLQQPSQRPAGKRRDAAGYRIDKPNDLRRYYR